MSRSLGSAVDYSIIARGLQRAEDVYYAENRIFHAQVGKVLTWGARTAAGSVDVRFVKGIAPDLVAKIITQSDELLVILRKAGVDALSGTAGKRLDKIAKEASTEVAKLADDAWGAAKIPDDVMKAWNDAAVGSGKTGRKLFSEAAGSRAHKLALTEAAGLLTKNGFPVAAKEALGRGVAPSLREIATAATKRGVMKAAAKSQESFAWLLEQGTKGRTYKLVGGAGGLTLLGVGVWQGYKILNAVDNVVNKAGKTLFGESWEGGDGLAGFGADNPVTAGAMGWGLVIGGIAVAYLIFKPKRAVVVS